MVCKLVFPSPNTLSDVCTCCNRFMNSIEVIFFKEGRPLAKMGINFKDRDLKSLS